MMCVLVNEMFVLLSAYLVIMRPAPTSIKSVVIQIVRKYCRQVPMYLVCVWIFVVVLPMCVSHNMFNHVYPWFGVKWFQRTAVCMDFPIGHGLLLSRFAEELGAKIIHPKYNSNPCLNNMWIFQIEMEVAIILLFILLLCKNSYALTTALIAMIFNMQQGWFFHYLRVCSLFIAFCKLMGVPRAASIWIRNPFIKLFAIILIIIAMLLSENPGLAHSRGPGDNILPTYAIFLTAGFALFLESMRQTAYKSWLGTEGMWYICQLNKLAFGVNLCHQFVQFYIEAHACAESRAFSLYAWYAHVLTISMLSLLMSCVLYALVQRPYTEFLFLCISKIVRTCERKFISVSPQPEVLEKKDRTIVEPIVHVVESQENTNINQELPTQEESSPLQKRKDDSRGLNEKKKKGKRKSMDGDYSIVSESPRK